MDKSGELRIAGVVKESIVDGPGFRYTLFVQGCPHHCEGCHNPQTHSFDGGQVVTIDKVYESVLENPLLDGVTFSGGEPFMQAEALYNLAVKLKKHGLNIICYSGFLLEDLLEMSRRDPYIKKLLELSDYLFDGKFEIENKTYSKTFVGSSNQRRIDLKKTIENGWKVVEKDFE